MSDSQAARNHYWNLTHALPAEVMGQIERLVINYGWRLEYGLDMQPSKEQVLARVRERFGDKAVDVAAQMPWMNTH
jgi:hypothetical protein